MQPTVDGYTIDQLRTRVMLAEEAVRTAYKELAEARVALVKGEIEMKSQHA